MIGCQTDQTMMANSVSAGPAECASPAVSAATAMLDEVVSYRADLPPWVTTVGDPEATDAGSSQLDVSFEMVGPPETVYALQPVRGRIRVNTEHDRGANRFSVWLDGIVYHYLINHRDHKFDLLEDDGPISTLSGLLGLIRDALTRPLHPCNECNEAYRHHANSHAERVGLIAWYKSRRRHPDLFEVESGCKQEWFDPRFWAALQTGGGGNAAVGAAAEGTIAAAGTIAGEAFDTLIRHEAEGVYSFPLFSDAHCRRVLEELDAFSATAEANGLRVQRPNSMNKFGLIVNQIGFEPVITALVARCLQPIAARYFPAEGMTLQRHHAFVVQYTVGKDTHLDMHTDDADVTFNICLGKEFEASGLTFCGGIGKAKHRKLSARYPHVKGRCVMHLGTRRHGADTIISGERSNLVIWCHNDNFRASPLFNQHQRQYEPEEGKPDPMCLSYTHDRDYGVFNSYRESERAHLGGGWCPPVGCEYPGFVEETDTETDVETKTTASGAAGPVLPEPPTSEAAGRAEGQQKDTATMALLRSVFAGVEPEQSDGLNSEALRGGSMQ